MILGMRKLFLSFMTAAVLSSGAHTATPDPVANAKAVVTCGNARFTVLTPEMIRIEYSETAQFEDRATFTIVNRNLDIPSYMILGNFHLTTEESYEDFLDRADQLEKLVKMEKDEDHVDSHEVEGVLAMAEKNRLFAANDGKVFHSVDEVLMAYETGNVSLHNRIAIPAKAVHKDIGT